jgi:hypothetical protein
MGVKKYAAVLQAMCGCVLGAAVNSVQAGPVGIDLSVSEDTAQIGLFSKTESPVDATGFAAHYFYNEADDRIYSLSMNASSKGMGGHPDLELGIKGKGFYFTQDKLDLDGLGLMLGVTGRYWLATRTPASISAEVLYAPEIVMSGDADNANEVGVRADLQLLPRVNGYIGYRYLGVDLENHGSYDFDEYVHIGVQVQLN